MKLCGRRNNSPPPLVAKSRATGCGPNRLPSATSRFFIDNGTASVQATSRRTSGDPMARPLNTAGTCSGRRVTGAIKARPLTCSGWFKASASAIAPPREWPTTSGRSSPSASAKREIVAA